MDRSAAHEFFGHPAGRKLTAHTKNTIGLSIITLCELPYGIELHAARHPQLRARNEHLLSMMVAPFDVFPLDHRVVAPYSEVRAALANAPIGPADKLRSATLYIVARDDANSDGPRLPGIRKQYEKSPQPKELIVLDGSAHAQLLFQTDQGERVMREILRFLSAKSTTR